jgi:hypothetical protein
MARNHRDVKPRTPPEPGADVAAALKQADDLLALIEDDLPERAWDKAQAFFESVQTGVKDVRATIARTSRVTEAQLRALDNWEAGVGKWIDPNERDD